MLLGFAPTGLVTPAARSAFTTFRHADATALPMEVCEGALPPWLRGSYYRNGPGLFEAGERVLEHWFDGYAMLLRIALAPGEPPLLSTRYVESEAYAAARAGEMRFAEFMTPQVAPGSGVLAIAKGMAALAAGDPTDNACVNVVRRDGQLQAMTETQRSWVELDPETLATRRKIPWEGDGVGQLSTAHAQRDPAGGGWINVGTSIAPPLWSQYSIFRLDDATPTKREVLATIPCADGAAPYWLHSFAVTRRKVVVIEQPAAYDVGAMLGLSQASHGSVDWKPERGTRLHVLDRSSGEVETRTVPAFFFFHIANAFDVAGGGVSLDVCMFKDPQILTGLRLDSLTSDALARDLPRSRLTRITLPADGGAPTMVEVDNAQATGEFTDLPSIAPAAVGRDDYRFVYAIGASRPTCVSNRLHKTDVAGAGGDRTFEVEGTLPGEPLFVPRPGGSDEDDGAVLSMATDADGGTSLYVLDAKDMSLLARARSPIGLPAGFHGEFVAENS